MTSTTLNELQLFTAANLGRFFGLSTRSIWRLRAAGRLPEPLTIAGSVRWRASDIHRWQKLGCPDQITFASLQQGNTR